MIALVACPALDPFVNLVAQLHRGHPQHRGAQRRHEERSDVKCLQRALAEERQQMLKRLFVSHRSGDGMEQGIVLQAPGFLVGQLGEHGLQQRRLAQVQLRRRVGLALLPGLTRGLGPWPQAVLEVGVERLT